MDEGIILRSHAEAAEVLAWLDGEFDLPEDAPLTEVLRDGRILCELLENYGHDCGVESDPEANVKNFSRVRWHATCII